MKRRTILITGATDGIGLALAQRLAPRHDLLLTGRRAFHPALPQGARYVVADQSDPQSAARTILAAMAEAGWNSLDNAVLNAGTGFAADSGLDDATAIRASLDINLAANLALAHALHGPLAKAGGTLSFVGSVAHKGSALFPAYAASKAGLHGLARALSSEWAGDIAVQIIHPGPTATDMHAKAGHNPGAAKRIFIPPATMAAMMEAAIARRATPVKLSFLQWAMFGVWKGRAL